jgi:hypothetical protein
MAFETDERYFNTPLRADAFKDKCRNAAPTDG